MKPSKRHLVERIEHLEQRVLELERNLTAQELRLRALEARPVSVAPPTPDPYPYSTPPVGPWYPPQCLTTHQQ